MNTTFTTLEDALRYANKMHEAIREDGYCHDDRRLEWGKFINEIAEYLDVEGTDVLHMAAKYL